MAKAAAHAKAKTPTRVSKSKVKAVRIESVVGLVPFSYQDVAYQIDVGKAKVYRRFIEIEKSKQYSIMNAFRGTRLSV